MYCAPIIIIIYVNTADGLGTEVSHTRRPQSVPPPLVALSRVQGGVFFSSRDNRNVRVSTITSILHNDLRYCTATVWTAAVVRTTTAIRYARPTTGADGVKRVPAFTALSRVRAGYRKTAVHGRNGCGRSSSERRTPACVFRAASETMPIKTRAWKKNAPPWPYRDTRCERGRPERLPMI